MHRGAYQDAYGSRNAHLRWNHAPLLQPVVHLRRSEPARGWGITAELSRNTSSEHHKHNAGPICMHRGAYQDAYGSRNAHLRRNHAPLSQPVVHLRRSEPVRGWGIPAELSRNTTLSTINTMQDQYACIEGPTRMHMDHAMPICGGIMQHCLSQWFTSDNHNRRVGGESTLN